MPSLPIVYHPGLHSTLPPGHRFPMGKFQLLGQHVVDLGLVTAAERHLPPSATRSQLELIHDPDYLDAFTTGTVPPKAQRRTGLPWSRDLVRRSFQAVGGTIHTMRLALRHGLACHVAGGTHHAFPDAGAGFCLLNDLAVAARVAVEEGLARRVLILDGDVHQGDGTAVCCADDDRIVTCSLHCRENFPLHKQRSDIDIEVPRGAGDDAYLAILEPVLDELLPSRRPDLVLYDAGVDPHQDDLLGYLALTDRGLARRDHLVLRRCWQAGVPIAGVIGGGYDHDLTRLVARHAILHRMAYAVWHGLEPALPAIS